MQKPGISILHVCTNRKGTIRDETKQFFFYVTMIHYISVQQNISPDFTEDF